MHLYVRSLSALLLASLSIAALAQSAQDTAIQARTRAFLDADAHEDIATVLLSVDASTTVYGSDVAEFYRGPDDIRHMLKLDAQLWRGGASIGPMRHVSTTSTHSLATIFFDADFKLQGRDPVPVRFCMVWKKHGHTWLLLQSSNSVVTLHQSAAEILAGAAHP